MARVALTFVSRAGGPPNGVDAGGRVLPLTYFRLVAAISLGDGLVPLRDAWVDTGTYLTVIPQSVWDRPDVRAHVEWLQVPPGSIPLAPLLIAGGSFRFRLGRIVMTAFDVRTNQRLASPVVANFLEDEGAQRPLGQILLGLRHGLLDGRRLVIEPDVPRAYLEDR